MPKTNAPKAIFSISYIDSKDEYVDGESDISSLAVAKSSADEFLTTAAYGTHALIYKSVLRVDQNMTTTAIVIK